MSWKRLGARLHGRSEFMKSNLPTEPELPKLSAAEAMKQPGLYFVTSNTAKAEVIGIGPAKMICIMIVADDSMVICNPTEQVTPSQLAPGLIFHGPVKVPV